MPDEVTVSPCPFCNHNIPDFNLDCENCHNLIPFCIANGRYIYTYSFIGILLEMTLLNALTATSQLHFLNIKNYFWDKRMGYV